MYCLKRSVKQSHFTYYVATVVKPSLLRDYALHTVIVTVWMGGERNSICMGGKEVGV